MATMYTIKSAARYLGIKEVTVKWHLYESQERMLDYVAIKTGESGEGHRHTNVLFTQEGLDWFKRNQPPPGRKPKGWFDIILELDPPPVPPQVVA